MPITLFFTAAIVALAALTDTADKRGNSQRARILCTVLNVVLWLGLAVWFWSAQRDGWQTSPMWGALVVAWFMCAVFALVWWLVLSTRGAALPNGMQEPQTNQYPKINGVYRNEVATVRSRHIRQRYKRP